MLFDLNGTLVDPSVLAGPEEAVQTAFDDANFMATLTALDGREAAFRDLLHAALARRLALSGRDPAGADAALERLSQMPPYPEARDALEQLRGAGFRLAVLTQSSRESAEAVIEGSGLRFDAVLSAPDSGAFKPARQAYRYGLEQVGAERAWFVAGHWWDIAGAAAAGLRTAWVSRTDRFYPAAMPEPDVRAPDLRGAAGGILAAM